ncbi:MAG: HAD-IA family hydrolase [Candidatus Riflebacteria bacterium]|nr:HAD-IA family hydrolase [Candidatus Riflebacteria bacterium]
MAAGEGEGAPADAAGDPARASAYFESILAAVGIPLEAVGPLLADLKRSNDREELWTVVPPGTPEALESLAEMGYTLGVISNSDGRAARLLARANLLSLVRFVIDSTFVGLEKPDSRIFRLGLDRAGVEARQAIYVGDLYAVDVVGARKAGITGVLVDPLWLDPSDCPRIRTVADLPGLLTV